jgi:hypothetical protein
MKFTSVHIPLDSQSEGTIWHQEHDGLGAGKGGDMIADSSQEQDVKNKGIMSCAMKRRTTALDLAEYCW